MSGLTILIASIDSILIADTRALADWAMVCEIPEIGDSEWIESIPLSQESGFAETMDANPRAFSFFVKLEMARFASLAIAVTEEWMDVSSFGRRSAIGLKALYSSAKLLAIDANPEE